MGEGVVREPVTRVDSLLGADGDALRGRNRWLTVKGARVTLRNFTGFAAACQEAVTAVLEAISTVGEERRLHLKQAKAAVDAALNNAHSGAEWYLADQLRRGIKEVEVRFPDAA